MTNDAAGTHLGPGMRQNPSFTERRKHDIQPCRLSLGRSAFRSDAFGHSRPRLCENAF